MMVHVRRSLSSLLAVVLCTTALYSGTFPGTAIAARRYTSGGTWPAGLGFRQPAAVAVEGSGAAYVADTWNNKVKKVSSSGQLLDVWGDADDAVQFLQPRGIAVDGAGGVYVADTGNDRIVKLNAAGGVLATWGGAGAEDGRFEAPTGVDVDAGGAVYVCDTGNNRIQKFNPSGGHLLTWGGFGAQTGQLDGPRGVAVSDSGLVYVADSNNHRIHRFRTDGTTELGWWWGPIGVEGGTSRYNVPTGVAVDSSGNVYVCDAYNNRIEKCDANGAALASWGTAGSGNGQFTFPAGVAIDGVGSVWVADTGNDRIQSLTSAGVWQRTLAGGGSAAGQLDGPGDVAVDAAGNAYVADTGNHRVQKFGPGGSFITSWGTQGSATGQFKSPAGIALDAAGNVYVADTENGRIQKFTANGAFVRAIGTAGSGDGQLSRPKGLSVSSGGTVYVADTGNDRIQRFTSDGTFLGKWGGTGVANGQFRGPSDVAVDGSGSVFVADTANHRVQRFTSTGAFSKAWGQFGSDSGQLSTPAGIAVLPSGNVIVTDTGNNRMQEFTATGVFAVAWGGSGDGPEQMWRPTGGCARSDGSVYVAETLNDRIHKWVSEYIDDIPPSTSASSVPGSWVSRSVVVTLTATDNASGVAATYYRIASEPTATYAGPITVSRVGRTTVTFWSVDRAGNVESEDSVVVFIDTVAPYTTGHGLPDSWTRSSARLTLSAIDDLSGVRDTYYRVGGGVPARYVSPVTVTGGEAVRVWYWSVDRADNTENPKTSLVKIDQVAPVTTTNVDGRWHVSPVMVTLGASDGGSGIAQTYVRVGSSVATAYSEPFLVSAEGATSLTYWSVDKVGNTEAAKSATVKVWTTGPVTNTDIDGEWHSEPVTVTLDAASAGAAITGTYYRVAGGAVTTYTAPFVVTRTGTSPIQYWSKDSLGRTESPKTAYVRVLGRGRISLKVASRLPAGYAAPVKLTGTLPGGAGLRLRIQRSTNGRTGWTTVGTALCASNGAFYAYVRSTTRSYYRAYHPGGQVFFPTVSNAAVVSVRAWLSTPRAPTTAYRTRSFKAYGYLKLRHTAGSRPVRLYCYRYERGRWVLRRIAYASASNYYSYTRYTAWVRLPYAGRWRIRAYHGDWGHAATWTGYRYVTVR